MNIDWLQTENFVNKYNFSIAIQALICSEPA